MSKQNRPKKTTLGILAGAALVLAIASLFAATGASSAVTVRALTAAGDPTTTCPIDHALTTSVGPPPSATGAVKLIAVTWNVTNDEDSGVLGYWALDYYHVSLNVWFIKNTVGGYTANSYYALKAYSNAVFVSANGAVSPQNGYTENDSAFGTWSGAYNATLTGYSFSPGTTPTSGFLGTKNYGGTTKDLLLGTYGSGQTGSTNNFDWVSTYFTAGATASFSEPTWGFVYFLNSHFHAAIPQGNVWCDTSNGLAGDIST
jgi:hypothetical protein